MELANFNVEELSLQNKLEIEGGILPLLLAGAGLIGCAYAAGQACGSALWYAMH